MKWLRDNRGFLLFVFAMLTARSTFADHYVVPSGSMERTLFPGDRVWWTSRPMACVSPSRSSKVTAGESAARGDVVVFDAPDDGTRLIKRVVAVGGDRLESARRPRLRQRPAWRRESGSRAASGGGPDVAPVRVPAGHLFVRATSAEQPGQPVFRLREGGPDLREGFGRVLPVG